MIERRNASASETSAASAREILLLGELGLLPTPRIPIPKRASSGAAASSPWSARRARVRAKRAGWAGGGGGLEGPEGGDGEVAVVPDETLGEQDPLLA
jgi:hypothetical protein